MRARAAVLAAVAAACMFPGSAEAQPPSPINDKGDTVKVIDLAREFHIVIRENMDRLIGSHQRIAQFRILMHGLGHVAGYNHVNGPRHADLLHTSA